MEWIFHTSQENTAVTMPSHRARILTTLVREGHPSEAVAVLPAIGGSDIK